MRSELEGRMVKLTKEVEATSKKAIIDYISSKTFVDEVNKSALEMFYKGFDECCCRMRLLYPDLDLGKL